MTTAQPSHPSIDVVRTPPTQEFRNRVAEYLQFQEFVKVNMPKSMEINFDKISPDTMRQLVKGWKKFTKYVEAKWVSGQIEGHTAQEFKMTALSDKELKLLLDEYMSYLDFQRVTKELLQQKKEI